VFSIKKILSFGFSLVAASLVAVPTQARVFSFQDNWVSAYLRGTGGPSQVGDSAYADTSGDLTSFDGSEPDFNFSGELGFAFMLGDKFALRIGIEGLRSKGVEATGNSVLLSSKHMDVESVVSSFNTLLTAEYEFAERDGLRYFWFGGGGYGKAKVTNDYTTTGVAIAEYGGGTPTSYKEAWYQNVMTYHFGVGMETYMLDNVTFNLEAGYRYMPINKFYSEDSQTVLRGGAPSSVSKGATVMDNNGSQVELDMSGFFVGVAFRFYIPPLD
jgi:hypothetical protein